ncbi:MAG: hypothetical protein JXQ85_08370 [Cognatishimia sp.]|uniref:hypothetical protein n=1 Tax=Cognatishimia sp. TaxID=2211648 RepID=UPI003B8E262A
MFRSLLLGSVAIFATSTPSLASSLPKASECRLLELAYKVTLAQKDAAFSDILVDCPGYETWEFQMTTRDNSNAFRDAMGAQLPVKVQMGGDEAKALFQRMISRGVPLDVAEGMVDTRAFDKALASLSN